MANGILLKNNFTIYLKLLLLLYKKNMKKTHFLLTSCKKFNKPEFDWWNWLIWNRCKNNNNYHYLKHDIYRPNKKK